MKNLTTLIFVVFIQTVSIGQNPENSAYTDTSKYRLKDHQNFVELEIRIDQQWESVLILDSSLGQFEYECQEIELNGLGSKELVIWWRDASYGTGGGTKTKGVQIWDIDSGKRLLDEIIYCSNEGFGRHKAPAYFVECQKPIEIIDQTIKVGRKTCQTQWTETKELLDSTSNCSLSTLEAGTYIFKNGVLKKNERIDFNL